MRWMLLLALLLPSTAFALEPQQAVGVQLHRLVGGVLDVGYWHDLGAISVGGLAAFGSGPNDDSTVETRTVGLGAQGLWHVWGTALRGMHLGAEARWELREDHRPPQDTFDIISMQPLTVPAEDHRSHGFHVGVLAGARWAWSAGLWMQAQLGVRQVWTSNTLSCCQQADQQTTTSAIRPMSGVTAGWAF